MEDIYASRVEKAIFNWYYGGENAAPVEEILGLGRILGPGDFVQVVDEDVGNIKIARMQAAQKAL